MALASPFPIVIKKLINIPERRYWIDSNYYSYVSKIPKIVENCDLHFYATDTVHRGWNQDDLIDEYCEAISTLQPGVIITHSMASLIVGAGVALQRGGCKLIGKRVGKNEQDTKVTWISSQGVYKGTKVAVTLKTLCETAYSKWNIFKPGNIYRSFVKDKLTQVEYCKDGAARPAHLSLLPDFYYSNGNGQIIYLNCGTHENKNGASSPDGGVSCMSTVAKLYVAAGLCGISSTPVIEVASPLEEDKQMKNLEDVEKRLDVWGSDQDTQFEKDDKGNLQTITGNDAMVNFDSCCADDRILFHGLKITKQKHKKTKTTLPRDWSFFAAAVHHSAGRCRGADNIDDVTKQPCTWMANMISKYRLLKGLVGSRTSQFESFKFPNNFKQTLDVPIQQPLPLLAQAQISAPGDLIQIYQGLNSHNHRAPDAQFMMPLLAFDQTIDDLATK